MTSNSYLPCPLLKAAKGLKSRLGSFHENAKRLSKAITFREFSKALSLALSPVSFSELKSLGKMIHGAILRYSILVAGMHTFSIWGVPLLEFGYSER